MAIHGVASFETITLYLWCDLEPFIEPGSGVLPLESKEAARRILEEARIIISGMIYGYGFSYIPYDSARSVSEEFNLTPVEEIEWGDKELSIAKSDVKNKRLFATVIYRLSDTQAKWRNAWSGGSVYDSTGTGEGELFLGYSQKVTALKNSMKEAIRTHMRKRLFNKPREIKGAVIIAKPPDAGIRSGKFIAITNVKIIIKEIIPYTIF